MARGREEHEARRNQLNAFGKELARRSKAHCELCGASASLVIYEIPPVDEPELSRCLMICESCQSQILKPDSLDTKHWHGLKESAWSEVPAVQVMAWRMLKRLDAESWAQDLLDQLYLEPEVQAWAESGSGSVSVTVDSNGTLLNEGDSVHLIKDLDVKGTSFVAKRGTVVKNIHLTDNPAEIEGLVNRTRIVLKTAYLKKA
ncbi:MAG: PhnA domain protein [Candidatus Melainabacteria bacterium HGW-Melainabacteria-1]|nr:MAG: PhnA domain protein [Candidatus Melainabacteria bacterium HGW-Melainabacteria-1]